MKIHEFTLVLGGISDETPGIEDALFEAGCDDALINFRNGTVYLDFSREASSIEQAVFSAIQNIESSTEAQVIGITPDSFVSESEIANRINKGRQTVSLWAKRDRNKKKPFPSPVLGLSTKRPLWRWCEVVLWLYEKQLVDKEVVDFAEFIEGVHCALLERNPNVRKVKNALFKSCG